MLHGPGCMGRARAAGGHAARMADRMYQTCRPLTTRACADRMYQTRRPLTTRAWPTGCTRRAGRTRASPCSAAHGGRSGTRAAWRGRRSCAPPGVRLGRVWRPTACAATALASCWRRAGQQLLRGVYPAPGSGAHVRRRPAHHQAVRRQAPPTTGTFNLQTVAPVQAGPCFRCTFVHGYMCCSRACRCKLVAFLCTATAVHCAALLISLQQCCEASVTEGHCRPCTARSAPPSWSPLPHPTLLSLCHHQDRAGGAATHSARCAAALAVPTVALHTLTPRRR